MTRNNTMAVSAMTAGMGLALLVGWTGAVSGHGMEHNPTRSEYIQSNGIPSSYTGLLNPLLATPANLSAGKELYEQNCTFCHGKAGMGDGELAADLEPEPATITGMYDSSMIGMVEQSGPDTHLMHGQHHHHPGLSHAEAMGGMNLDAYMFWALSEGGEPMESSMPAFKDILSEEERWQILLYVANDFETEPN